MALQWTSQEASIVQAILARHLAAEKVWAYGSRVNGKAKAFSDLDLVIIGSGEMPTRLIWELREAFSASDLPYRVDVHDWHGLPEDWKSGISAHHAEIFPFV